jgi:hypothetical protein
VKSCQRWKKKLKPPKVFTLANNLYSGWKAR